MPPLEKVSYAERNENNRRSEQEKYEVEHEKFTRTPYRVSAQGLYGEIKKKRENKALQYYVLFRPLPSAP